MKKFIKTFKSLLMLLLIIALSTGCSNNKSSEQPNMDNSSETEGAADNKNEKSTLILGLDDTFAPMGFRDEKGELVGFDIDLAKEASKRMGVDIKFQPIEWSMKETELDNGNIDFIWNGFSITEERKEKVAFTKPYLENSQLIITLADSKINSKADLKGAAVAVQAESSALDAVNNEPDVTSTFKDLVEFSTNNEAFNDLESGRSDAIVVDGVLARYYMKQKDEKAYKVLEENFGNEEYAVGLRKSDTELLGKLNAALDEIKKDGTYDKIYSKWFSEN